MRDKTSQPNKVRLALKKRTDFLYKQGAAYLDSAQLEPAKAFLERALEAYLSDPDSAGAALCYLKLGRVVELLGEFERARGLYQHSLDLHIRLGDKSGTARSEAFLGNVAWAQGDYPTASKFLADALTHFKEADDLSGQIWVTDIQGNLRLAQGDHEVAERLHRAAIAASLQIGETPLGRAWNDYHLAAVDLFRSRREEARAGFLRALKIFSGLGDVLGETAAYTHLCGIACDQKDYVAAEKFILKSLKLVIPTMCRPLLIDAMTSLARLLLGRGQNDKALGMLMFVLSHPTCRQQTKDEMLSLAKSMEAQFSQKELQGGFGWAKHFTLEEMAAAWVKNLSAQPGPKGAARLGMPLKSAARR